MIKRRRERPFILKSSASRFSTAPAAPLIGFTSSLYTSAKFHSRRRVVHPRDTWKHVSGLGFIIQSGLLHALHIERLCRAICVHVSPATFERRASRTTPPRLLEASSYLISPLCKAKSEILRSWCASPRPYSRYRRFRGNYLRLASRTTCCRCTHPPHLPLLPLPPRVTHEGWWFRFKSPEAVFISRPSAHLTRTTTSSSSIRQQLEVD